MTNQDFEKNKGRKRYIGKMVDKQKQKKLWTADPHKKAIIKNGNKIRFGDDHYQTLH